MPRILVTGLPNSLQGSESLRDLLVVAIPMAVEGAEGFGIARDSVFVHALPDLADGRGVLAFTIEGLLVKPERTAKMRRHLCDVVADALAAFLDRMRLPYESIVGWCVQMNKDEDGFVRRPNPLHTVRPPDQSN